MECGDEQLRYGHGMHEKIGRANAACCTHYGTFGHLYSRVGMFVVKFKNSWVQFLHVFNVSSLLS